MSRRQPQWGSPAMQRAIRKHDRQFARKHGGPKPKGGCPLFALSLLVPVVALVAAAKGKG
jgi:hypothetical protein